MGVISTVVTSFIVFFVCLLFVALINKGKRIFILKGNVKERDVAIAELQQDMKDMKSEFKKEFTKMKSEFTKEITELRKDNVELRKEIAELRKDNAELRKEVSSLKRVMGKADGQIKRFSFNN